MYMKHTNKNKAIQTSSSKLGSLTTGTSTSCSNGNAKIQINTELAIQNLQLLKQKKYTNVKSVRQLGTDICNGLGIPPQKASKYGYFVIGQTEYTIRVSNHNANCDTFAEQGELNNNISIKIRPQKKVTIYLLAQRSV